MSISVSYWPAPSPTADEVIFEAYADARNDRNRYAVDDETGSVIGGWDEAQGRFVAVACWAITGVWVSMPFELLINGKPVARNWREVPRPGNC